MTHALKAGALALTCVALGGCSEAWRRAAEAAGFAAAQTFVTPSPKPRADRPRGELRPQPKKD